MTESNHVRGSFWTVLCIPILYNSDITLGKRVMDQIRDFGLRTSAGDSSGEILQKKKLHCSNSSGGSENVRSGAQLPKRKEITLLRRKTEGANF